MLNRFMPMGKKGKWTADVVLQLHLFIMFKFFV